MYSLFQLDMCTYNKTKKELNIRIYRDNNINFFKKNNNGTILYGYIKPDNTYHEFVTLKLVLGELSDLAE